MFLKEHILICKAKITGRHGSYYQECKDVFIDA